MTLGTLHLEDNSTNPMQLTVTVEKVGTDQARAKVLAGAPFAVDIPVTLVDGTLAGSVTVLSVAAGEVYGTAVTVTRTAGTTAAVTVDVDLTTQPTLPVDHSGYIFVKAATGLPETILPGSGTPAAPTNFRTTPGDGQVALAWDAPVSGSGVTGHEYRYKTTGTYTSWTAITDSGVGGATGVTVTGLTNAEAYTFELRAVNATGEGAAAAVVVIPMLGICGRTQQIEDAILAAISGVDDCAAVTDANLAAITSFSDAGADFQGDQHASEGRFRRADVADGHQPVRELADVAARGDLRRPGRADPSPPGQPACVAARGGVRRAREAGISKSGGEQFHRVPGRDVRRPDGDADARTERKRTDHASRRAVLRSDGAGDLSNCATQTGFAPCRGVLRPDARNFSHW